MTLDDRDLLAHLQSLELELLGEPARPSPERLRELLAVDFSDFGCSGRVFDREAVIAALGNGDATAVHAIFDFTLLRLAEDSALATYRIESRSPHVHQVQQVRESLRSSLWIHEGGSWILRFHQGTRKA